MVPNFYIVYSQVLDSFLKIHKLSIKEIDDIFDDLDIKISNPDFTIQDMYSYIAKRCLANYETVHRKYGEVGIFIEAVFDAVTEVYPMLTAENSCQHFNSSEDTEKVKKKTKRHTLSSICSIQKAIEKKLVGQKEAVKSVADIFKLINSGFESFSSLFFIGPTGVGKTELGKLVAEHYFKDKERLLKINCGEYASQHEYAKLIGCPPGYIGFNEKGILTDKAEKSSKWVILFDEIEKANDRLHNLLLGLLDDGYITDSHGTNLDFSNSVFIFTSNAGMRDIVGKKKLGFTQESVRYDDVRDVILDAFKEEFSPEFINRIEKVVFFNELSKEDVKKIVMLNLKKLPIKPTKKLVDYIVENGYSAEYGARNIKRFIKQNITLKIADNVLSGSKKEEFQAKFTKGNLEIS